jgi:hypothetical protein
MSQAPPVKINTRLGVVYNSESAIRVTTHLDLLTDRGQIAAVGHFKAVESNPIHILPTNACKSYKLWEDASLFVPPRTKLIFTSIKQDCTKNSYTTITVEFIVCHNMKAIEGHEVCGEVCGWVKNEY